MQGETSRVIPWEGKGQKRVNAEGKKVSSHGNMRVELNGNKEIGLDFSQEMQVEEQSSIVRLNTQVGTSNNRMEIVSEGEVETGIVRELSCRPPDPKHMDLEVEVSIPPDLGEGGIGMTISEVNRLLDGQEDVLVDESAEIRGRNREGNSSLPC